MRICFKYPSRARPDLFIDTLHRYQTLLSGNHDCFFVISCDEDDPSMNNDRIRAVAQPNCKLYFNPPPQTKVSAVNANLQDQEFDLLVVVSDDMLPQCADYDDRIADIFQQFFPDGDGVLHLNDGRVGKQLNTLPICDRKYYDRFGYVYAPCYTSVFVDNEFQEVSECLGRAVYVPECIIKHVWIGEYDPRDRLHLRNESFYQRDGRLFESRRRAGFPPVSVAK